MTTEPIRLGATGSALTVSGVRVAELAELTQAIQVAPFEPDFSPGWAPIRGLRLRQRSHGIVPRVIQAGKVRMAFERQAKPSGLQIAGRGCWVTVNPAMRITCRRRTRRVAAHAWR